MREAGPPGRAVCTGTISAVNRRLSALLVTSVVMLACASTPPERSSLPDVGEALDPPAQCTFLVGEPQGVLVQEVTPDSAADGLLIAGDVIVAFDNQPTLDSESLLSALGEQDVGDVVEISVLRGDEETEQTLTLGDDSGEPLIGVMIRTQYQAVEAADIDTEVEPGPLTRPISISGLIYLFDAGSNVWERTEVEVGDEVNWVATTTGIYALQEEVIMNLLSGEEISHDGFEGWEPIRVIGSAGEDLILVVTQEVPDEPERVAVGVSRFDPFTTETVWTQPVVDGFGIPISAWGSPDGDAIAVVGVNEDGSQIMGVDVWDGDGVPAGMDGLVALGTPVGWMDDESLLFRTDLEVASVLTVSGGATEEIALEPAIAGLPLFPVGDGRGVLALDSQSLVLDDVTVVGDLQVLAENCGFSRVGEPGWSA